MVKQLNGRVNMFKNIGRGATWYVPATLGVISVASAQPELRMRKLFEEGFGVVGGALGTMFGSTVVATSVMSLLAFSGLCIGPFGVFVVIFILASAGGIAGMKFGNKIGGDLIYDYGSQLINGKIYNSMDQLISDLQ